MRKEYLPGCVALLAAAFVIGACSGASPSGVSSAKDKDLESGEKYLASNKGKEAMIETECIEKTIARLKSEHPETEWDRIVIGTRQAADKWRKEDGCCDTFETFSSRNFISDPKVLDEVFLRFQDNVEQVFGHLHEVNRHLKTPITLDTGPTLSIDHLFAKYNLSSHVVDDLYRTKIAFVILLNFRIFTLDEKMKGAASWTRNDWAKARMSDIFSSRVPSDVSQKIQAAFINSDTYISEYNIHMHHLLTEGGVRLFPKSLKLITHWGLRDELISQYKNKDGHEKQRLILKVMERIIDQTIPQAVINNPYMDWSVAANTVKASDVIDFDPSGYEKQKNKPVANDPEPNSRYEFLLGIFKAVALADPYYRDTPTYIDRKFNVGREIKEKEVVALLESVLKAPVLKDVAALIKSRLGRDLEPFDIWYRNFATKSDNPEEKLNAIVNKKYPNVQAFQADLPRILKFVGYDPKTAKYLSTKIVVDPSRGVGHATGAQRREDSAHLRTRVGKNGMDYKGYNIAIHELGHNVEQVLSLNKMDHYLLEGVPNTAFTETFAFAFQALDQDILGIKKKPGKNADHLKAISSIWSTFEIAGVSMVDIRIWNWMYDNPEATPKELKEAYLKISKDVWNDYFEPVFGIKDQTVLGIYSHIIDAGLYTPDYAIGHIIESQLKDHFAKNGLAKEMERMCKIGSITPGAWMEEAVGEKISAEPLLKEVRDAIDAVGLE